MDIKILFLILGGIFFIIIGTINILNYKKQAILTWTNVKSKGKKFSEKFVILLGIIFMLVGFLFLIIGLYYLLI